MATNTAPSFQADIEQYIADETLPLAQRHLVVYNLGDKLELPKGRGTNYTATRFQRLALPYAPLAEGAPAPGEFLSIQQVTGVCQQWGDLVRVTDVAELTIKHPVFEKAVELTALQVAETNERNTYNNLMALTQINYVNSRGARSALVAGDVLDSNTLNRTNAAFETIGVWQFQGDQQTDVQRTPSSSFTRTDSAPSGGPHYVLVAHPLVVGDFRNSSTFVLAASYSSVNRLYNAEVGQWNDIRVVKSNLVPSWTGVATVAVTAGTAGSLQTGSYFVQVTGQDTQNQYESRIYQGSASTSVTAPEPRRLSCQRTDAGRAAGHGDAAPSQHDRHPHWHRHRPGAARRPRDRHHRLSLVPLRPRRLRHRHAG